MTSQEMLKLLKKNGFETVSQNGSHVKNEKFKYRKDCHRSLSLQRPEKGNGAGNIKAGWIEIIPPNCTEVLI